MLSRCDANLVRRDAVLPGLATLLDPCAFVAALNSAKPAAQITSARIDYIRYKPGRSCLVGYRLGPESPTEFVTATALRSDAHDKRDKALEHPGRMLIADRTIVVADFPFDDKLPALIRLGDAVARQRLLSRIVPAYPEWFAGAIETIRYKPERRLVARLLVGGAPRAVLKFYAPGGYTAASTNARAFRSGLGVSCARLLGHADRRRVLAWNWLPGRSLADALNDPNFESESVAPVGAALAELHGQAAEGLTRRSRSEETAALAPMVEWLSFVCPPVAERARNVALRLDAELERTPAEYSPLHGDFYANQVLLSGATIGVIDFDEAFLGDPASDLGSFQAHLEGHALRGRAPVDRVEPAIHELIKGYRTAAPSRVSDERIALYAAIGHLRLAAHPFRSHEPHWPEQTAALLERAEELLRSATPRTYPTVEQTAGALP